MREGAQAPVELLQQQQQQQQQTLEATFMSSDTQIIAYAMDAACC
jgi:hypothetical protein